MADVIGNSERRGGKRLFQRRGDTGTSQGRLEEVLFKSGKLKIPSHLDKGNI